MLTRVLLRHHGEGSALDRALGQDRKGPISLGAYLLAVGLSALEPWIGVGIAVAVALMRVIPDRRIERVVE